jgi:hypothetical protein
VTVSHYFERLSKKMRRLATLFIQKPSPNDKGLVRLYDSEGGVDDWEEIGEFRGLTDTRESYREHESSNFDVILDGAADDVDDGPTEEEVEREKLIRTAVNLYAPWDDDVSRSYKAVADAIRDRSESWVGDRVREWKNGEHREIVSAPNGGNE